LIKSVKEQIRKVPGKGLGYGVLRYLHQDENIRNQLKAQPWEILYNYLGQIDQGSEQGPLKLAAESTGKNVGDAFPFLPKFEINFYIEKGILHAAWSYSALNYRKSTVESLGDQFLANLNQLNQHCVNQDEQQATPSDFLLGDLVSFNELDEFLNTYE